MTMAKRPDAVGMLTGVGREGLLPHGIGPIEAREKFTPDGQPCIWPGNTFICHVPKASPAFTLLTGLLARLQASPFARFFTYLPAPSLHMTVFNGMNIGAERNMGFLKPMELDWSRDRMTSELAARVADAQLPQSFQVKMTDLFALHSVTVKGASEAEECNLRRVRKTLKESTGIAPKAMEQGDTYLLHITLAYLLRYVSQDVAREMLEFNAMLGAEFFGDAPEIELGPVEFCTFDTMHHFEPVTFL